MFPPRCVSRPFFLSYFNICSAHNVIMTSVGQCLFVLFPRRGHENYMLIQISRIT